MVYYPKLSCFIVELFYREGVVKVETKNWELSFSQLRIRHCPMSIMAFEFPILEMDFVLNKFEFKVFTLEINFQFRI